MTMTPERLLIHMRHFELAFERISPSVSDKVSFTLLTLTRIHTFTHPLHPLLHFHTLKDLQSYETLYHKLNGNDAKTAR